ncbi:hypothetical protein [Mucilaginibacter polytrichastri]|uniref:Uncharacterized protein n=1 Tax=Mucilaginibacter polytrichastri TaxID=1302689 RepID=A0A1Q5ZVB4_9SPHI|nr:hypothetical protein [Mucilaginibacter polytrichastri]OKS85666.1 hypothetical protein RG47T_1112 [Mucilaginibacter polytrichastri]SFT27587.1 hypothetical protein SAMN04487890_1313 [Mucilaginibacter polytrichastri]
MNIVSTGKSTYGFEVVVDQAKLAHLTNFISYRLRDQNDNELVYENHKEIISLDLNRKQYEVLDQQLSELLKGVVKKVQNNAPSLLERQKCELMYIYKYVLKIQTLDYFSRNSSSETDVKFNEEFFQLLCLLENYDNGNRVKITFDRQIGANIIVHLPPKKDTGIFLNKLVDLIANHYPEFQHLSSFAKKLKRLNADYKLSESEEFFKVNKAYPMSFDNNLLNAYHSYILLPYIRTLTQFPFTNAKELDVSERQGAFLYGFFNLMSSYDKTFEKLMGNYIRLSEREFVKNLRRQLVYLKKDYIDV